MHLFGAPTAVTWQTASPTCRAKTNPVCNSTHYVDKTGTSTTANDWVCRDKIQQCPTNAASFQAPICENIYGGPRTTPGYACWCRPQCSTGQLYVRVANDDRMHSYDECRPCDINEYNNRPFPHFREACTPCPAGSFTVAVGSRTINQCLPPRVIPYASSHRVFYYFGAALK